MLNLLLIENSIHFQNILKSHFEKEGFNLLCASLYSEAATIISKNNINVTLIDLTNLKMEGLQTIKRIKNIHPTCNIITLNNSKQFALSLKAMKLGIFDDFLLPINVSMLTDRIKAAGAQVQQISPTASSIFRKYQNSLFAATFAEAGESRTAIKILEED
ncbi:MAG: response regulator [Desulfohalobiaceae bacterium]